MKKIIKIILKLILGTIISIILFFLYFFIMGAIAVLFLEMGIKYFLISSGIAFTISIIVITKVIKSREGL